MLVLAFSLGITFLFLFFKRKKHILSFPSCSQYFFIFLYPFCPSKIQFNHSKFVFLLITYSETSIFILQIFLVHRTDAARVIFIAHALISLILSTVNSHLSQDPKMECMFTVFIYINVLFEQGGKTFSYAPLQCN